MLRSGPCGLALPRRDRSRQDTRLTKNVNFAIVKRALLVVPESFRAGPSEIREHAELLFEPVDFLRRLV
jgi:hypothetical protein